MNSNQMMKFCQGISKGLSTESSASIAGVSATKVYSWLRKGQLEDQRINSSVRELKPKKSEEEYLTFYTLFLQAKAELELELLGSIRSSENFKAQQWLLEKMNDNYSDGIDYLGNSNEY